MAVKTRAVIKAENASDFPDNTARLISPADLRGQMDDIVDSALFPEDGVVGVPGPPGADSGSVDGMAALRAQTPVAAKTLRLNYHTTPGDLGAGQFVGVTSGGPYADDGGTVCVGADTSKAWLRVWDHVRAHVGWFGAKCDPYNVATDDYIPVTKCLSLFTNGRTTTNLNDGIVDVGPGFCHSQPLIYGGGVSYSFRLVGTISLARGGYQKSIIRYTGPATIAAILFYGANEWYIEDLNTDPGLALNGIVVTADNTYNNSGVHTTTHAITAGSNVVVTPSGATPAERIVWLLPGCFLGIDAGGPNFEIIVILSVDTVAGTFTADFKKNHASGVLLGGGAPCSSGHINRCRLTSPISPIWTTLSGPSVDLGPGPSGAQMQRFPIADITGIKFGYPVRVGKYYGAEILYPLVITPGAGVTGTIDAYANLSHATGELVMYPTAAVAFGNRLLGTVQVDNVWMYDTVLTGIDNQKSYAGIRQFYGGNVKAFVMHGMMGVYCRVPFAFEASSGQYLISGGTSAGCSETLFLNYATMTVDAWEDESETTWLVGAGGANAAQATFIGCTMQGGAPADANDIMFNYSGSLTFIGCDLRNGRDWGTSLPIIVMPHVIPTAVYAAAGIALINCNIAFATLAHMNFVQDQSGTDVIKDGTGRIMMMNCIGGVGGNLVQLPNILPPLKMWQGTATYDPASIAAGTVGAAQTMTVSGAALGDLVEASFSLDLQGVGINAWVSAADTVKYQFRNPTAAPIDLGSGTVKCRVKK
jgi:hypothetical protein